MNTTTVNISFQSRLLKDIDKMAHTESRSRSELLREAARLYIDRKRRWDSLFKFGRAFATSNELKESDVESEIRSHRKQKARSR